MKAGFTLSLILTLSPPVAYAALGEVVQSFPSPAGVPQALAISGTYLYVYAHTTTDLVYRVIPSSGSVAGSFSSPFGSTTSGLGYEYGGYIWIGRLGGAAAIARCAEATGSVYSSFTVNPNAQFGGLDCEGIPTQGGTLRAIISQDNWRARVWRYTTVGSLIGSFVPESTCRDPAWDYVNEIIWIPQEIISMRVFGYTTDGSLVTSFAAPAERPYGAAYLGGYLWLSTTSPTGYIWKIHCPAGVGVGPASLGRVKALFR